MGDPSAKITVRRPPQLLQAELAIAYVLRYGVILCGLVIGSGLAMRVFHLSPVRVRSREIVADLVGGRISGSFEIPHSVAAYAAGFAHLDPDVIVAAGLLLLIALPVIRVGMTVVLFLIEGDLIYLGITLFVFSVLVFGIVFGKAL